MGYILTSTWAACRENRRGENTLSLPDLTPSLRPGPRFVARCNFVVFLGPWKPSHSTAHVHVSLPRSTAYDKGPKCSWESSLESRLMKNLPPGEVQCLSASDNRWQDRGFKWARGDSTGVTPQWWLHRVSNWSSVKPTTVKGKRKGCLLQGPAFLPPHPATPTCCSRWQPGGVSSAHSGTELARLRATFGLCLFSLGSYSWDQ